jgi:DNA-binding CsgD family transcriptional regulator
MQQPRSDPNELSVTHLTSRKREILHWIAEGKRDREISVILNVSSRTIQKHVQNILEKLHVETRGAAAAWWYYQMSQRPNDLASVSSDYSRSQ